MGLNEQVDDQMDPTYSYRLLCALPRGGGFLLIHSFSCPLVRSHNKVTRLIRSICNVCLAHALFCVHSIARSLALSKVKRHVSRGMNSIIKRGCVPKQIGLQDFPIIKRRMSQLVNPPYPLPSSLHQTSPHIVDVPSTLISPMPDLP